MDDKTKKTLERVYEEIANYEMIAGLIEENPDGLSHLHRPLVQNVIRQHKATVECVTEGKPLVASYFTNAPELYTAMDLHWYCLISQAFGGGGENPHMLDDLEALDNMPLANDICTLLRLGIYYLDAGLLPKPTAVVPLIEPCDGVVGAHEVLRNHREWRDLPFFAPDPPYYGDERSISYFADELKRMVAFLEETTGQKMDYDRLKEVCDETNKQYALWAEYNVLRGSVPCPHGHTLGMACFALCNGAGAGDPEHTKFYNDLIIDGEKRIKENDPEVKNQKIRLLWFDVQPIWFADLAPWLEEEWGACVIQDMFGFAPYTPVDTSSIDTMLHDLGKRNLMDGPMVRQARGVAANFLTDIENIVRDMKIDCVIVPGHMGHKDGSASISFMREKCREIETPFLYIGLDQFDKRYTTVDEVKNRISQFFESMGLG
jgi:hypothetical protein